MNPDLESLLQPLRDTATETLRLLKHLGGRLDAFALDLARDVGTVSRDAQAFATTVQDRTTTFYRATPRAAKLAQAAASLVAKQRWLRLAAAARGETALRPDDHRELA